ncbi:MAG: hypothetical protein ACRDHN_15160, partial [Thermomicrobiales bacterium]
MGPTPVPIPDFNGLRTDQKPEALFLELSATTIETASPRPASTIRRKGSQVFANGFGSFKGASAMAGELQTTPISAEHPAVIDALGRLRDSIASSQLGIDADMVFRAADFAIESHDGQARRSGEPYV